MLNFFFFFWLEYEVIFFKAQKVQKNIKKSQEWFQEF